MTGRSYPITFTGTDVNSYRATDLTGAQFKIADTGAVICNVRFIIVDGMLLPGATYYDLPLVSVSQYNAVFDSLAPAPAPMLANKK